MNRTAMPYALIHHLPAGHEVNAAKALVGMFGTEIANALKARCLDDARHEPSAVAVATARRGATARSVGVAGSTAVVHAFPSDAAAAQEFRGADGGPDQRAMSADVGYGAGAIAAQKNTGLTA